MKSAPQWITTFASLISHVSTCEGPPRESKDTAIENWGSELAQETTTLVLYILDVIFSFFSFIIHICMNICGLSTLRVWRKVEICSRFVLIRSKQKVGFHTECAPQLFYWTPHARCLIEIDDKGDTGNNSFVLKTQTNTHQLDQFWNFLYPWKIVISRVKGVDVRSATRVLKAATIIFFVTWKLKQWINTYQ